MRFSINGITWEIEEMTQKEIKTLQNERKANNEENVDSLDSMYFGITLHDRLKIIIDKDLPEERKKTTLIHELGHCYISTYITYQDLNYSEEMLCDIIANSFNFINGILDSYFE